MMGEPKMRKNIFAICAVVAMGLAVLTIPAKSQQDKSKRPSPPASAQCNLGGGHVLKIDYSSPRMKGRKVYGDLVPWGQPWRAGANEATTFVTDTDLLVGGKLVPAGSYTIFTVPNQTQWQLIVQKTTGEWGIPYPPQKDAGELLRTDMKVSSLPAPVENFTIGFDQAGGSCTLNMDWETTRASVKISPKM
jgi:hypothetical protein